MKTYEKMAEEVFEKGDKIIQKRRKTVKKIFISCGAAALCLCICAAFGIKDSDSRTMSAAVDKANSGKNDLSIFTLFNSDKEEKTEAKNGVDGDCELSGQPDYDVPNENKNVDESLNKTEEPTSADSENHEKTVEKTTAFKDLNKEVNTTVGYSKKQDITKKPDEKTTKQVPTVIDPETFYGTTVKGSFTVKEIHGTLLVLADKNGSLYSFNYGEMCGSDVMHYNIGDVLTLRYDPEIAETYPMQLTVREIISVE